MTDFFKHIQAPVFNDVLDALCKPFTSSDGKRHVLIDDLVSERTIEHTPASHQPTDVVFAALVALREAGVITCQFRMFLTSVVIYEMPASHKLVDASAITRVFDNPKVANACITMLEARHTHHQGKHTTT